MPHLDPLLRFVSMTHQLRQVKRAIYVKGEDQLENDCEHQYQLTLVAWYLVQSHHLDLDLDKVIRYALVHDLVEVYAGDIDTFAKDKSMKKENERLAAIRLQSEFPEFGDLHATIAAYESKLDKESRFVHALDKILPTINNFLDDGRTWKKRGITFEMVKESKRGKINQHPLVEELFEDLAQRISQKERELFPLVVD
ncbi:MAG: HD domain-containing protein [Candidatus Diapherotrites archaeon]|nr:HD domain-containing protein [Candidatus Diapherotrites archaeon]